MLAEPKRKIKFSDDPRNTNWTNDDNKFGQKLMEKMGWSKGRGLGVKEDGNPLSVAVSLKNDTRGMGWSKRSEDNWIAHQDDFQALLSSLNEDHGTAEDISEESRDDKVISLEHTSRSSKGRVHYQKFTKGKDLSLKSKTDLDCVFGKRKSRVKKAVDDQLENENDVGPETAVDIYNEELGGLKTVTSTDSVQDYFLKKMTALKSKRNDVVDSPDSNSGEQNGCELSNVEVSVDSVQSFKDGSDEENEEKRKSRKRDRKSLKVHFALPEVELDEPLVNDSEIQEDLNVDISDVTGDAVSKKKKKKSKSNDSEIKPSLEALAVQVPAVDDKNSETERDTEIIEREHLNELPDAHDDLTRKQKKSKKKKKKEKIEHDSSKDTTSTTAHGEESQVENRDIMDTDKTMNFEGVISSTTPSKKTKKSKKDKLKNVKTESVIESDTSNLRISIDDVDITEYKKRKNDHVCDEEIPKKKLKVERDNDSVLEADIEKQNNLIIEGDSSKKKKKVKVEKDTDSVEEADVAKQSDEIVEGSSSKKKKKSKKKIKKEIKSETTVEISSQISLEQTGTQGPSSTLDSEPVNPFPNSNPEKVLMEYAKQCQMTQDLRFVLVKEGPDHKPVFTMHVEIGSRVFGSAKSKSKKESQRRAAIIAVSELNKEEKLPGLDAREDNSEKLKNANRSPTKSEVNFVDGCLKPIKGYPGLRINKSISEIREKKMKKKAKRGRGRKK